MTIPRTRLLFIILLIAMLSFLLSLFKGSTSVSLDQLVFMVDEDARQIFFNLRLPRTTTAFVVGGLLGLSGVLMQLLLHNPLADPYALGISGGAALFTLLLMCLGFTEIASFSGAWLGAFCVMFSMIVLANKHAWRSETLLLFGMALSCGFSAGISFILLISPKEQLHDMLFWLAGDLNDAGMPWFGIAVLSAGLVFCFLFAPGFDVFSRGEMAALTLGLNTKQYRFVLYLLSSLFTATAVMLAGCVGFVGLIVPHIARFLVGFHHRTVLPTAVLLGGSLLVLADCAGNLLFAPAQLPVGMVLAFMGVPTFVYLLLKR